MYRLATVDFVTDGQTNRQTDDSIMSIAYHGACNSMIG